MVNSPKDQKKPVARRPPGTTPQVRENQLVAMAYDEAEKMFREGRATSQVVTQLMKQGGREADLRVAKLERENELLRARVEQISAGGRLEALTEDALKAFKAYSGQGDDDEYLD